MGEPDRQQSKPLDITHQDASPTPLAKPSGSRVAKDGHVAAPPMIDFGKVHPGTEQTVARPLFNLLPQVASCTVHPQGDASFFLRSAPTKLFGAGTTVGDGLQDLVVTFVAPPDRGVRKTSLIVDVDWGKGHKPERVVIPVVAQSALDTDPSTDEQRTDEAERKQKRVADQKEDKRSQQAKKELDNFDRAHPGFNHNGFNDERARVKSAMDALGRQQTAGIEAARAAIMKYVKATPPKEQSLLETLAMIALDIASAGVANVIAKQLESGLKAAVVKVNSELYGEVSKQLVLSDAMAFGISDAVKEGLKISSRNARSAATAEGEQHKQPAELARDPRIEFINQIHTQHNIAQLRRDNAIIDATAYLRPTAAKNPHHALELLKAMKLSLEAEFGNALQLYREATVEQWFAAISELKLGVHRAGEGESIRGARGVVDIGFQAGISPRDPVVARTAIIRGVSNAAAQHLEKVPLLGRQVPIRLYGLPSAHHAQLLVSVTRTPEGGVAFLDQTNDAAPGASRWLAARANGNASAGAESLLTELLGRSLEDQHVRLTTDQDPKLEGG